MRVLFAIICAVLTLSAYSQSMNVSGTENISREDVKSMTTDIIKKTPITKSELLAMIDKMIASGQITKKDGDATKEMVEKMSDKELDALKSTMINMMGSKIDQMTIPSIPKQ